MEKYNKLEVHKEDVQGRKNALVLLHGYGANAYDLAPLFPFLFPKKNYDCYCPNGLYPALGVPMGRAWFPIPLEHLMSSRQGLERISIVRKWSGPEFLDSLGELSLFIQNLEHRYEEIIIAGFSQGAMMTSHLLTSSLKIKKGIIFSGALIGQDLMKEPEHWIQTFHSHGEADPLLPLSWGRDLVNFLTSQKMETNFYEFEGGHEIPRHILFKLRQWLE